MGKSDIVSATKWLHMWWDYGTGLYCYIWGEKIRYT